MNGLELANKRIKEKEELTSEIFLWLVLEVAEIIEIFKQEAERLERRRKARKAVK